MLTSDHNISHANLIEVAYLPERIGYIHEILGLNFIVIDIC